LFEKINQANLFHYLSLVYGILPLNTISLYLKKRVSMFWYNAVNWLFCHWENRLNSLRKFTLSMNFFECRLDKILSYDCLLSVTINVFSLQIMLAVLRALFIRAISPKASPTLNVFTILKPKFSWDIISRIDYSSSFGDWLVSL